MYVVTVNQPGYLPEAEPEFCETWELAREALRENLHLTAGGDATQHAKNDAHCDALTPGLTYTLQLGGFAHNLEKA